MKRFFACLLITGFIVTGCSKTNEQTESKNSLGNAGGNTSGCDTVNMKYLENIQPIIQANCYSCHGNGRASGSINLDTYDNVKQHTANDLLINVITHASGYPAMPQGAPKLSDCDISKIKDWIARGTLNN